MGGLCATFTLSSWKGILLLHFGPLQTTSFKRLHLLVDWALVAHFGGVLQKEKKKNW